MTNYHSLTKTLSNWKEADSGLVFTKSMLEIVDSVIRDYLKEKAVEILTLTSVELPYDVVKALNEILELEEESKVLNESS